MKVKKEGKKPMNKTEKPKDWIQSVIKHPGALHEQLGIPNDKKIPLALLKKSAESSNKLLAKRANLALTLRKINK